VDDFGLDLSFATFRTLDPAIGRWLQVDPYAESFASLNPYNSMGNNPISVVDPDGDFIFLAAAIAGIAATIQQGLSGNLNSPTDAVGTFAVGYAAGGIGAGVGGGISSSLAGGGFGAGVVGSSASATTGFIAGAASGAGGGFASGFVGGFGNGLLQGNSFGNSLGLGLKAGGIGALSGGVTGGISKGIQSLTGDRNFWTGDPNIYKNSTPLIASNGQGANFADVDSYTLKNESGKSIYWKPEDSSLVGLGYRENGAYQLGSGFHIKHAIDGLATPIVPNNVFKAITPVGKMSIRATSTGVSIGYKYNPSAEVMNAMGGGGWYKTNTLGSNWDKLFRKSRNFKVR